MRRGGYVLRELHLGLQRLRRRINRPTIAGIRGTCSLVELEQLIGFDGSNGRSIVKMHWEPQASRVQGTTSCRCAPAMAPLVVERGVTQRRLKELVEQAGGGRSIFFQAAARPDENESTSPARSDRPRGEERRRRRRRRRALASSSVKTRPLLLTYKPTEEPAAPADASLHVWNVGDRVDGL